MFKRIYLQWYRDKGRGQEASTAMGAVESLDGSWPIARIDCKDNEEANALWDRIYKTYDVNAMTWYTEFKRCSETNGM